MNDLSLVFCKISAPYKKILSARRYLTVHKNVKSIPRYKSDFCVQYLRFMFLKALKSVDLEIIILPENTNKLVENVKMKQT